MESKDKEIIISFSLANYSGNKLTDELLITGLKELGVDVEFHKYKPTPGKIYAAKFDWKIVTKISTVASLLGFFWLVYSEFIEPNKNEKSNEGIFINIENLNIIRPIWIGNEIRTKEDLDSLLREMNLSDSAINYERTKKLLEGFTDKGNWEKQ